MTVRYECSEKIATLTLDRPDKLNALNDEMYALLYDYIAKAATDDGVRAVILTGAGRAFCSGGDIGGMAKTDVVSSRVRSKSRHRVISALYTLEKPVIAAVRGPVYGIANALVMASDMIIASDTTRFSMAFKKVGTVPDGGAVFFLTQYLGIARAKELVYTARPFSGAEAREMGIVYKCVPDDALEKEAYALATELAQSATYAIALAKKMFQAMALPTLETLMDHEALSATLARLTHDHKEGVAAFQQKRAPQFLGR